MQRIQKTIGAIILILLGFGSGFYFGSGSQVNVLYVSQSELLELETKRIEALALEDKQFFRGKPQAALKIIERLQRELENEDRNNLVLIAGSELYGKRVRSVSKAVHQRILKELE